MSDLRYHVLEVVSFASDDGGYSFNLVRQRVRTLRLGLQVEITIPLCL
jgi:hypothetical protein